MRAAWSFIAGDSRLAPLGVVVGAGAAWVLSRYVPVAAGWAGAIFVGIVAAGLVAGVFERL